MTVRFLDVVVADAHAAHGQMPSSVPRDSAHRADGDSDGSSAMSSSASDTPDEDDPDAALLDLATAAADSDSETEAMVLPSTPIRMPVAPIGSDSPPPSLRQRRAFSPDAIDIASTDDDEASAPPTYKPRRRRSTHASSHDATASDDNENDDEPKLVLRKEKSRVCGAFGCTGDDIERMLDRTAWLSGMGLAVFAESQRVAAGNALVGHLASTLFIDVKNYRSAKDAGDVEGMNANKGWIWDKLRNVRLRPVCRASRPHYRRCRRRLKLQSGSLSSTSRPPSTGSCSSFAGRHVKFTSTTVSPHPQVTPSRSRRWRSFSLRCARSFTTPASHWIRGHGLGRRYARCYEVC